MKGSLTTNGKSQSLFVCVHVILCFSEVFALLWDDRQCQQEMIHSENEDGFMHVSSVSSIQIADTLIMTNNSSQGNFSYLAINPNSEDTFSNFCFALILLICFLLTIPSAYDFEGHFFFYSPFYTAKEHPLISDA